MQSVVGWRAENQFLNAVKAWSQSSLLVWLLVCFFCLLVWFFGLFCWFFFFLFHWIQRKMLELGSYIFAKRARYLWPPSAVRSMITRVKLSVKCTVPDPSDFQPVQLTTSNQTIIFTGAPGSTSFLLKPTPLANLDFQRPAVLALERFKKKAALDFVFIIIRGR